MKMSLDAAAGEMDQQSRTEHLPDGNDVAGECSPRLGPGGQHRKDDDQQTQPDGAPKVRMNPA